MELEKKYRNTHEQLRTNHIDTLEILQTTQDENEKLKDALFQLQVRVESMNTIYNTSDTNPTPNPNSEQSELLNLMQRNRELVEQVSNLKEQVKQLQANEQKRLLLQQKAGGASIEDLTIAIQKLKQKEYYDGQRMKELEMTVEKGQQTLEQMKSQYEEQITEHKQNFLLFQNQLYNFQQNYQDIQKELQIKAEEITQLVAERDQYQSQVHHQSHHLLLKHEKEMKQKNEEITLLTNQLTQYERLLQEKDTLLGALQEELQRCKSSMSEIHDPEGLRTELPLVLQFTDSQCDSVVEVVPPMHPSLSPINDSCHTTERPSPTAEVITEQPLSPIPPEMMESINHVPVQSPVEHLQQQSSPGMLGNIRFQEFMDLKLENRELKLRLAEITQFYGISPEMQSNKGIFSKGNKSSGNHSQHHPPGNINVTIPTAPFVGGTPSLTTSVSIGTPKTKSNPGVSMRPERGRGKSFDLSSGPSHLTPPIISRTPTATTTQLMGYNQKEGIITSQSATSFKGTALNRSNSNSIKFPKVMR